MTSTAIPYSTFAWQLDAEGIVTVTLDDPDTSINTVNRRFLREFPALVERLYSQREDVAGVIIASAKKDFCAGADLKWLAEIGLEDAPAVTDALEVLTSAFRRLERLGRPVVALLSGAALGGGYEIALACHHRILVADESAVVGLPEIKYGLLPGAGGTTRIVRMLGLLPALAEVLMCGAKFAPAQALDAGLVDALVDDHTAGQEAAREWIRQNPGAMQPWDVRGASRPDVPSPAVLAMLPARFLGAFGGSPAPAQTNAIAAAVEGCKADFDSALRVETPYSVQLLCGPISTNLIRAEFLDAEAAVQNGSVAGQQVNAQRLAAAFHHDVVGVDQLVARIVLRVGLEAMALLSSGMAPASIEQAGRQAGFARGPLELLDLVSLDRFRAGVAPMLHTADGGAEDEAAGRVLHVMLELAERPGQAASRGFYDYVDGQPVRLWSGLADAFSSECPSVELSDAGERFMFAAAIEAVRCRDEEVVSSHAQINYESVGGAGFPRWSGGALQFIDQYEGGVRGFVARAADLAKQHGPHFEAPSSLLARVTDGGAPR